MIGAIAGDMIGSPYEVHPIKHKEFFLRVASFTDDTVLTVAVARAILDSESWEDAVKNAVSLGGDADTMACIAGGIAQAYYKEMPEEVVTHVRQSLTPDLLEVVDRFCEKFPCCVDFLAVRGAW